MNMVQRVINLVT